MINFPSSLLFFSAALRRQKSAFSLVVEALCVQVDQGDPGASWVLAAFRASVLHSLFQIGFEFGGPVSHC